MRHLTTAVLIMVLAVSLLTGCGKTIHEAAQEGDVQRARDLLDAKADVNAKDKYGWTPLRWAIVWSHTEIGKLLIDAGANVGEDTGDGLTLLHLAIGRGQTEFVKLLIDAGADVNAEAQLTYGKGDMQVYHWTPLHEAALQASPEMTKLLLEAGADVWVPARAPVRKLYYSPGHGANSTSAIDIGIQPMRAIDVVDSAVRASSPRREAVKELLRSAE